MILGFVLLGAAFFKSRQPKEGAKMLNDLGLVQPYSFYLILILIATEALLGTYLILDYFSQQVYGICVLLFICFSLVLIYGKWSGKITDCRCYGMHIPLKLEWSISLNLIYIAVSIFGWLNVDHNEEAKYWSLGLLGVSLVLANAMLHKDKAQPELKSN